jgi:hypothetical protein
MKASLKHAWDMYCIFDNYLYDICEDMDYNGNTCNCEDDERMMYAYPNHDCSGYSGVCLNCGGQEENWS